MTFEGLLLDGRLIRSRLLSVSPHPPLFPLLPLPPSPLLPLVTLKHDCHRRHPDHHRHLHRHYTNTCPGLQMTKPMKLSCIQDSQSYARTLAALQRVEPDEILLHDGTRGRVLSSKVVGAFHGDMSRVLFVSRQYFDQDKVQQKLSKIRPTLS